MIEEEWPLQLNLHIDEIIEYFVHNLQPAWESSRSCRSARSPELKYGEYEFRRNAQLVGII